LKNGLLLLWENNDKIASLNTVVQRSSEKGSRYAINFLHLSFGGQKMKKLFSTLLAAALVAGSAISANAAAGLYTYDESDGEYWNPAFEMLDKTAPQFILEDGTIAGYNDPSYTDATGAVYPADITRGWYEVILCNLGTKPEWFPAEVEGKMALCVRGDSTFTVKSENAKTAGAVFCLVGNNCRAIELVDETGTMTGEYENVTMSVDYYTIPQCSLSSDITARLVAQTADISIADAVVAVENVFFGDLELSVSHAKSAYVFFGTIEEYEANKTRTDANTVTAGGGIGGQIFDRTHFAALPRIGGVAVIAAEIAPGKPDEKASSAGVSGFALDTGESFNDRKHRKNLLFAVSQPRGGGFTDADFGNFDIAVVEQPAHFPVDRSCQHFAGGVDFLKIGQFGEVVMIVRGDDIVQCGFEFFEIQSDADLIERFRLDRDGYFVIVSMEIAAVAIVTFQLMGC
jgi:hypothetical protein